MDLPLTFGAPMPAAACTELATPPGEVLPFSRSPLRLVTVSTFGRRPLLGSVLDGVFQPTSLGTLARQFWLGLSLEYPEFTFEWFEVQPTAVVAVVRVPRSSDRDVLRGVVAHFKAMVTRSAGHSGRIWDRRYAAVPVAQGLRSSGRRPGSAGPSPAPVEGVGSSPRGDSHVLLEK